MTKVILPGSTIGVLGSGQLGRMFAIAARRLGYRVHVFSPDDDTPTGQVADVEIKAAYEDLQTVAEFARQVQVVTFEFENVPATTIDLVERYAPVRPAGQVLHIAQQRLREKKFLQDAGFPVTPFQSIRSLSQLREAATAKRLPAVLKTAAWGYDGKGQGLIRTPQDVEPVWNKLATREAILEQFVDYSCEFSVVGARGHDGQAEFYGPIRNDHRNHILDVSITPSGLSPVLCRRAVDLTRAILDELQVVGVLCVEFFLTTDHKILVNELAPRPHNSGHLTVDAHETCQFEQQVRAVCHLPLGSARQLRPAAMANLLGDEWRAGRPAWERALQLPDVKLHLYGKREPRDGRKMGHLTALASTASEAAERVLSARRMLQPSPEGSVEASTGGESPQQAEDDTTPERLCESP